MRQQLFIKGNIITMGNMGEVEALLVDRGRIVAAGKTEEVMALAAPDAEVIALDGKTVLPGFYDAHLHLIATSLGRRAVDFSAASSIADLLEMIRARYREDEKPVAIFGRGLSEFKIKERRLPTRRELDAVAPDVPVVLASIEFHTVVLNSIALHRFQIPFTLPSFEKDGGGRLTGRLRNRASFVARRRLFEVLTEEDHIAGLESTFRDALSRGVTSIATMEGGPLFHERHVALVEKLRPTFPIDVHLYYATLDIKDVTAYGYPCIGGDIFLDGSFRSQNAALFEPYSDDPDNLGMLFFEHEELVEFIAPAHASGLQVAVHAVGGRAIDALLDAYEEVLEKHPREDHRHRIEHFELPTADQIQRAAALGLVLVMHPTYELFFRGEDEMYASRLGIERALLTNPLRAILDAGIPVAGASDSDIMPVDPLLGMHAAVNHPNPASRITPREAIALYTSGGAYAHFEEKEKGSLQPGMRADFVILDRDPLTIAPESLKDIRVLATYKDGNRLYEAGGPRDADHQ